ncbi:hypothetical protein C8A03DRAFT_37915 [Achaetomium macrosporum]|uniref:Uncharacterized protein n=1 Tax=Achaetomium macrosporum TaxID=79813 RepID=A0AAN7C3H1_9PEZI|nr:hypothetical protein C8A03DRAFT_37915 [Achaetomium macrosporum]
MSPRVKPYPGSRDWGRHFTFLPLSKSRLKNITKVFRLHNEFLRAAWRKRCHYTHVVTKHGDQSLELHTAIGASFDRPEHFALSCTYFPKSKLSLGVIFGCGYRQVRLVRTLLWQSRDSPEVASHPLLIFGIFAELQLYRMQEMIMVVPHSIDPIMNRFDAGIGMTWELNEEILRGVLRGKEAEEEIGTTRAQLKDLALRVDERIRDWEGCLSEETRALAETAKRFKRRFADIDMELESMMTECRVVIEQLQFASDMFEAQRARREGLRAAQETKASTHQARLSAVIAFVAMLYLPITSVATIFATPVFNFQNYWWDQNFRPTDSASSSASSNTSSLPETPKPVLSGYFWIYLVTSIVLTIVTLLGWQLYIWWKTRQDNHEEDDDVDDVFFDDRREWSAWAMRGRLWQDPPPDLQEPVDDLQIERADTTWANKPRFARFRFLRKLGKSRTKGSIVEQ